MVAVISVEHTVVSLHGLSSGLVIQSWSSDTDALTMPSITGLTVDRGATGAMMAFTTGDFGGPVSIKLQPIAPELPTLFRWAESYRTNLPEIFGGTVRNVPLGFHWNLRGGVMTEWPAGLVMGKGAVGSLMFTFEFEEIVSGYSNARIAPARIEENTAIQTRQNNAPVTVPRTAPEGDII